MYQDYIGRINAMGTVDVFNVEDDEPALWVPFVHDESLYNLDGVVITVQEAYAAGLQIEGE